LLDVLDRLTFKLRRDWHIKVLEQSKNFTVVDFLLNEGEWDLCNSILIFWRQSLESSKDIEDEDPGDSRS